MQSGLELAKLVSSKQISAEELVLDTIEKIEQLNPTINAVVAKRYEKALFESRTRDFAGKLYGGVPLLLKDLGQQLKGEPNTSGSRLFQNYVSMQTDNLVKALEQLGFIILGQTATPEFGFKNYTASELYGVTRNPLDITRYSGGSSGGSASAVASGMVPIAAASDGGGSIRIPASWTGLYGLKPTRGRIPVGPSSYRGWQGAAVNFVLTRHLQDTETLFYALQTEQWESPFTVPKNQQKTITKPLRIAFSLSSPIHTKVSQDAKNAVLQTVDKLLTLGYRVEEVEPELDGVALMESYYVMNSVETASMIRQIEHGLQRKVTKADMESMSYLIYLAGKDVPAWRYSQVLNEWDRASATMHTFHQAYDLFLTPTTASVAPKIKDYGLPANLVELVERSEYGNQNEKEQVVWDMFLEGLTLTPFTQQANLTGQPAISLPMYQAQSGLPLGVQFTSAKGREDLLFHIAKVLQG